MKQSMVIFFVAFGCGGTTTSRTSGESAAGPDALTARVETVRETLFGTEVRDDYRWMETERAEVRAWLLAHGSIARKRIRRTPEYDELRRRVHELVADGARITRLVRRGDRFFYMKSLPEKQQPALYVRDRLDGPERVLIDPVELSETGSIDGFSASHDGSRVAFNWSESGAEVGSIRVVDVHSGKLSADVIERVWGEFAAAWLPGSESFFYTQMASAAESSTDPILNMRIRRHVLGSEQSTDPMVLGGKVSPVMSFEPVEFPEIFIPEGSKWALAFGVGAHSDARVAVARLTELSDATTPWRVIYEYEDQVAEVAVRGDELFAITTRDSPNGRVTRRSLADGSSTTPETVVAEDPSAVLDGIYVTSDSVLVRRFEVGSSRLYAVSGSQKLRSIETPGTGTIHDVATSPTSPEAVVSFSSWTDPGAHYRWSPENALTPTSLKNGSTADFSIVRSELVSVPSFDGEGVPMTLVYRKGVLRSGKNRVHLKAYGAYGYTVKPSFFSPSLAWLERGGIIAIAHVRGSGAKGRAWHEGGKGPNKHVGVKDLLACARYLVSENYTRPNLLGVRGASMGGVLVGGAMATGPELFGAVILEAAVLNPTRILAGQNAANQFRELGGSPRTEMGFRILHAMDPYLKLVAGPRYPPTMFFVGLEDNRVEVWNTTKFAARLHAVSPTTPVLIRVGQDGHGVGTSRDQRADKLADRYAFLLAELK